MIQLRVRSEFFFGETFAPLDRLVKRLKALGAPAAGIVDPGTWGHVQWAEECKKEKIIPLFGVIWAWLLLGEPLTLTMAVSGALILGGVALSQSKPRTS